MFRERRLLGTRDLLGEDDEIQPNGKTFRKQELGEYRYLQLGHRYSACRLPTF
jgi:long-chain acyl-CoA synthetase